MNISSQLSIGWHLFRRECYAFAQSWKAMMIDNTIIAVMFSLVFGYFMPAMGAPLALRMPMFLGTVIVFCISVSYMVALTLTFDIDGPNLFSYHLALPVHSAVIVAAYVAGALFRSLLTVIPLLVLGTVIIGDWAAFDVSVGKVLLIIPLVSLLWVLIFMSLSMWLSKETMLGNVWPRFLVPLNVFGCVFYPWAKIARHAPGLAQTMLLNPVTHSIESVRAAFLPAVNYVPFAMSTIFLVGSCVVMSVVLLKGVSRRLRPVRQRRVS
jgi:ABC-type polysaccharide/polyol phosphate export permease